MEKSTQTFYKSINHSAKILECISSGKTTLTEISQYGKLSKSTASRLLTALEKANLVIRDPIHRKFFIGSLLNRLLENPENFHFNLITTATMEMNRLSELCGEAVILCILIGTQNIRLKRISSRYNLKIDDEEFRWSSAPGASARALLAQLDDKELSLTLNYISQESNKGGIDLDKNKLLMQVGQIRKQKYAVTFGERIEGAIGLSAIVKGYYFPVVLAILGVRSRFEQRLEEMVPEILSSANRISQDLSKLYAKGD